MKKLNVRSFCYMIFLVKLNTSGSSSLDQKRFKFEHNETVYPLYFFDALITIPQ